MLYVFKIAYQIRTEKILCLVRDREAFVEYRQFFPRTRWIYIVNNSKNEVKDIVIGKLGLRDGRNLFLHDVLFAPTI